jgi:Domain of unknown function (DUF4926)
MNYHELDTVILNADIATHGLRKGDVGAVVHVYSPLAIEVEFVTAAGRTQAVVTLSSDQLRPANRDDALSVRRVDAA